MRIRISTLFAVCCAALLWSCSTEPEVNTELLSRTINMDDFPGGRPRVSVANFDYMLEVRADLIANTQAGNTANSKYYTAYKSVYDDATALLSSRPITVFDRPQNITDTLIKFGIDPHNLVIISKYVWWEESPEGSGRYKWVTKDGYVNTELYNQYDAERQTDMINAVKKLAYAYFFSGREEFAYKCVDYLKAWFINSATATLPNYEYGQMIPDRVNYNKGSTAGIINSQNITNAFAATSLIIGSEAYTPAIDAGMRNWAERLYTYMTTEPAPLGEVNAANNHGTAYDQTVLGLCLFTGKYVEAKAIVDNFATKRIFAQIENNGQQPAETRRDQQGYHYSTYNLQHLIEVCEMAKLLDEDLFFSNDGDGTISKAGEYLGEFLDKPVTDWNARGFTQSSWDASRTNAWWQIQRILSMDPSNAIIRAQLAAGRTSLGASRVGPKSTQNIVYRYYLDQ